MEHKEYINQCWNCAQEFDALSAQWCGCSAVTPSKVCPFCYTCMCQAPKQYRDKFWKDAPDELLDEKDSFNQPRDKLGDLLVKQKLLTTDQLLRALKKQQNSGEKLGAVLVDLGYVDEHDINRALGEQFDMMSVDLNNIEIQEELISEVGVDLMLKYQFIPIEKQELPTKQMITVAVPSPLSPIDIEKLQKTIGVTIYSVLAGDKKFSELLTQLTSQESKSAKKARLIQQAKVRVNSMIAEAIKRRVSRIILENSNDELTILFIFSGKEFTYPSPPEGLTDYIMERIKRHGKIEEDAEASTVFQEGKFTVQAKDRNFTFFVTISPSTSGERITLSIVDEKNYLQPLKKIFLDPGTLQIVTSVLNFKSGLVFIIGPANAGKTTTNYALLNSLEGTNRNVVSIERNTIINLPSVFQEEFDRKELLATKIQSALAKYPDVLSTPEIDDAQTMRLIFEAAKDMIVLIRADFFNIAELFLFLRGLGISQKESIRINAIIKQRLIPSVCKHCKQAIPLGQYEKEILGIEDTSKTVLSFRGTGCEHCFDTGYSSILPLSEVVLLTTDIKQKIVNSTSFEWLDQLPPAAKTRSIKTLVLDLMSRGVINSEDIRALDFGMIQKPETSKSILSQKNEMGDTDAITFVAEE